MYISAGIHTRMCIYTHTYIYIYKGIRTLNNIDIRTLNKQRLVYIYTYMSPMYVHIYIYKAAIGVYYTVCIHASYIYLYTSILGRHIPKKDTYTYIIYTHTEQAVTSV
jgi:hypothetical protein